MNRKQRVLALLALVLGCLSVTAQRTGTPVLLNGDLIIVTTNGIAVSQMLPGTNVVVKTNLDSSFTFHVPLTNVVSARITNLSYTTSTGTVLQADTLIGTDLKFTTATGSVIQATTLVGTPAHWPTNASVIYVATNGNDSTAVRGRSDRPWLTPRIAATNLADGDTLIFLPGTHTVEGSYATNTFADAANNLIISNRTGIKIFGFGATLFCDDWGDMLTLANCTNVEIAGIKFLGTLMPMVPTWKNVAAIYPRDYCRSIVIHDCSFYDLANQGISSYWQPSKTRGVYIYNNFFQRIGTVNACTAKTWAEGTSISGIGHDWIIRNNTFILCNRAVEMQLGQYTDDYVTNVVIRGNTIISNRAEAIYSEGNYWDVDISDNAIYNGYVDCSTFTSYAIAAIVGNRWTIANNTISGMIRSVGNNDCLGIAVFRATNVVIRGNDISRIGNAYVAGFGIYIGGTTAAYPAQGITILNNTVHDFAHSNSLGITIGHGSFLRNYDIKVIGNVVYDVNNNNIDATPFEYSAFSIQGASNVLFSGNCAFDTAWPVASKVTLSGLYISPLVTNIVVGDNDFSGVKLIGISNACKLGNIRFTSMQADSYKTNQVYW